jgi:uncharacterized membrane protein
MNDTPTQPLPATSASKKSRKPLRERSPVLAHLRSVLFAGLLTAIPIFITVYIISFFYGLVTKPTGDLADGLVKLIFGESKDAGVTFLRNVTAPALAVLFSLLIVYILGLLGTFLVGRRILAHIEQFISNLPLIKGIYGTTKQVIGVFSKGGGGAGFQRVVLVEFPRQGTWTVAFVTNTVHDGARGNMVCCFIPMTPNPTSGFFQLFPENQVRDTDWSVDMGIKIVLSGGLLAPHELQAATTQPAHGAPIGSHDAAKPHPPAAQAGEPSG